MNLFLFLPETVLLAAIVILLCLTLAKKDYGTPVLGFFLPALGAILVLASFSSLPHSGNLFSNAYRVDPLAQGFKCLIALSFFFTAILNQNRLSIPFDREIEYGIFLLSATLGMMMMTGAVDLLALYVSMELSSYSLYLLASLRQDRRSPEAGVKYLIFGAAASGVFLWGASLVTGLSGTTSLLEISGKVPVLIWQPAFSLGLVFASFAFLFKLSGFPLHFWAPDVYESAPTPVTNFIATASKATAVAILIRFFMLTGIPGVFIAALGALAFVSMTLGNTVALVQQDVKRLLAYSSIAQAGYILTGLLAGSFAGYSSSFFYAFAYVLMNTGAFLVTSVVAKTANHDNPRLSDFDGLAERSPFLALLLLLSLLSLAGIPPLVGFTGKWILFSAAMDKGHWFLVLWGVLNSVVSLFYYLTLVKHAYLEKPVVSAPIAVSGGTRWLGLFLIIGLIALGLFPNAFITFAQQAILKGAAL
ncbi:MAG: NADH-quinone oxidoreductase subunit N [Candidatus Omnitrophica bacterium]|nr:NADH-quinone oxidoreductase subunit N [Candidatus Omnitrophota bacterium]